jgi:hypothetical protein
MAIGTMNEASSSVVGYFSRRLTGFTFSREEAEYLKNFVIDGAVHDGWTRPDDMTLLPQVIAQFIGVDEPVAVEED